MTRQLSKLLTNVKRNLDKILAKDDAKALAYQSYKKIRSNERLRKKLDMILELYTLSKSEVSELENPEILFPGGHSPLIRFISAVATAVVLDYNVFARRRGKYINSSLEASKSNIAHKLLAYFIEKNISKDLLNYYLSIADETNLIKMFQILERQRYEERLDTVLPELASAFSEGSLRVVASSTLLSQLGNRYWFTLSVYIVSAIENPEFSKEIYKRLKEIYDNRENKKLVGRLMENLESRIPEMRDVIERTWKIKTNRTSDVTILEYYSLASSVAYENQYLFLSYVLRATDYYFAYKLLKPLEGKDIVDMMLFYVFKKHRTNNSERLKNAYSFNILQNIRNIFGFKFYYSGNIAFYLRLRSEEIKSLGIGEIRRHPRYTSWHTYKLVIYNFEMLRKYIENRILKN